MHSVIICKGIRNVGETIAEMHFSSWKWLVGGSRTIHKMDLYIFSQCTKIRKNYDLQKTSVSKHWKSQNMKNRASNCVGCMKLFIPPLHNEMKEA